MNEKTRYLSKNVILFMLNGFAPKIFSFVLIPLYTYYLTASEYGIVDLINTTVFLLIPIFTLDMQDSMIRFALDKNYPNDEVFSIGMNVAIKGTILIAIICVFLSLLRIPGVNNLYLAFIIIIYFTTACNSIVSYFCRGIDKVSSVMFSSTITAACTVALNILLLAVWHWGMIGFLLANSLGTILGTIYCIINAELYKYWKFSISKAIFKDMLHFSFPLIFGAVAWWFNTSATRYILTWEINIEASGLFAVAFKIPTILTVFQSIFSQAWSISAIKEFDANDTDGFISNTHNLVTIGMILTCSLLMIFNIPIAWLLYSNEFFEAWYLVPPLLVSVVFLAGVLFIGGILMAVKDTKAMSYSVIIGAIANFIGSIFFIWVMGIYGASFSAFLSYGIMLFAHYKVLRKHIRLRIKWQYQLISYLLLIIQMGVAIKGTELIFVQIIIFIILCYINKNAIRYIINNILKKF